MSNALHHHPQAIELIMFNAVMRMDAGRKASLSQLVRGVFEFLSSGCLLPGALVIVDPTLVAPDPQASTNTTETVNSLELHSVDLTLLVRKSMEVVAEFASSPKSLFQAPSEQKAAPGQTQPMQQ